MAWRYLLPGFALAATVAAADCAGSTTISTAAQATALATCATYKGTIVIDSKTTDNIALDGIEKLQGSLISKNAKKVTSISAETMKEITGTFQLTDLTSLTTLGFPALTSVDEIIWEGLPTLAALSFTKGVDTANVLDIQNTGLASLEGINLMKIEQLFLANNFFLEKVDMQLKTVTTALGMSANGRTLKVDFPNLETAYNMTFRNVTSLSIPSLTAINGSMGFYSNFFSKLEAANLTEVGSTLASGTLSFVSNGMLTDVSMPKLKVISGGFQIANNTKLDKIDGFNNLEAVGGTVQMYGDFSEVELPKLKLVKGAFNIQSTKNLGNTCNKFHAISGPNNDIRGTFTCDQLQKSVPKSVSKGGSSGSGSGSSGAGSLLIPYATGIIGLVAAIFGML